LGKMKRVVSFASLVLVAAAAFLLIAPHVLPAALSFYRSDIWFDVSTKQKQLFVTIDDAPSGCTGEILGVLKKHGVPATFFVIADRVKAPMQLEEIVSERHTLGNHLKTTRACSKLTFAEFQSDFDTCSAILERHGKAEFFRPASDFGTKEQIAYAKTRGYQAVMGTVFPLDHWISDPSWLIRIARWQAVPGGILILHDGDVRGHTTAQVLDRLIPELKEAGYSFGRLEQRPNQPPEPTVMSVTPRADARVAPATTVAHL
jgi:chitin deacetylase